jgi:hypothetical protein
MSDSSDSDWDDSPNPGSGNGTYTQIGVSVGAGIDAQKPGRDYGTCKRTGVGTAASSRQTLTWAEPPARRDEDHGNLLSDAFEYLTFGYMDSDNQKTKPNPTQAIKDIDESSHLLDTDDTSRATTVAPSEADLSPTHCCCRLQVVRQHRRCGSRSPDSNVESQRRRYNQAPTQEQEVEESVCRSVSMAFLIILLMAVVVIVVASGQAALPSDDDPYWRRQVMCIGLLHHHC